MYRDLTQIIEAARALQGKTVAIAAAAEGHILCLAQELRKNGFCRVILVDNGEKLRAMAAELSVDLTDVEIVDEPDAERTALTAVALVSGGRADVLVKGNVNTSLFLKAVLNRDCGLRTGRRLSSMTCYDVPGEKKLFFLTDGGMNVAPDFETKVDIIRNAVAVLHVLGIERPKVALLSANERVMTEMRSTVDAAEICAMAARGELPEAVYEGPIAFDVAVSPEAAATKGIQSHVSGDVDLFLVPNIETGNCLGKAISYYGHAKSSVVMLGATHPVVMTSRSASLSSKLSAVAFALLLTENRKEI